MSARPGTAGTRVTVEGALKSSQKKFCSTFLGNFYFLDYDLRTRKGAIFSERVQGFLHVLVIVLEATFASDVVDLTSVFHC